jgi:hypothetical protein
VPLDVEGKNVEKLFDIPANGRRRYSRPCLVESPMDENLVGIVGGGDHLERANREPAKLRSHSGPLGKRLDCASSVFMETYQRISGALRLLLEAGPASGTLQPDSDADDAMRVTSAI